MEDRREVELVNQFKEYLEILIEDFCDINYDKVKGKNCSVDTGTVVFYKGFIGQLISRLKDIMSKIKIADILGYTFIDEFTGHESVVIAMKDRFQKISTPGNLKNICNKSLDLRNGYSTLMLGSQHEHIICIYNESITSPKVNNLNGKVLTYRIVRRWVSDDDPEQLEHEIIIHNPISNMRFINHYVANRNFINDYEESGDDEPVEKGVEVVEDNDEFVETDTETCEEKDNVSDDRDLKMKTQFIEYLDYLIKDFKNIDYGRVQEENRRSNGDIGARVIFYKEIISQIIKLLIALKSKVTIRDVVGERKYGKFTSTHSVGLGISGRFPEISMPDGWDQLFHKELHLGNSYEIGLFGIPRERELYIWNDNISSPRASRYNLRGNIIGYKIYQSFDSEGRATGGFDHSIIFYNPIANLRFIKGYEDEDDDDPVEPEVEQDDGDDDTEWDVEEDDFQPEDWFPSDTRKEESDREIESTASDNNKTLNFSLPGPNGSKISINLNINITFDQ